MGFVMTSRDNGEQEEQCDSVVLGVGNKQSSTKGTIKRIRYYLNPPYQEIYFTVREAECVHYYMLGYTLTDIALKLEISHRTIEYYIVNVKKKLRVHSKQELFRVLKQSRFIYNKKIKPNEC